MTRGGSINEDVLAAAEAVADSGRRHIIPKAERAQYRLHHTLRDIYIERIEPERLERVAAGTLARKTLEKERQCLTWFERYSRPDDWPASRPWPGLPLAYITPRTLQITFDRAGRDLSAGTVGPFWCSLRTILNAARKLGGLASKPTVHLPTHTPQTVIYTPAQIATAFDALKPAPSLQVAFVVGVATGLRPEDLFLLRWADLRLDGPVAMIETTAIKTGKLQGLPLHPLTVRHIRRLPQIGPQLFTGLCSPDSKDPEKSKPARARTALTKMLFRAADLLVDEVADPFYRPWKQVRPTCNERLESHRPGAGCFMLGHSLGLNSRNYRQPSQMVIDAVLSLPQPDCFQFG